MLKIALAATFVVGTVMFAANPPQAVAAGAASSTARSYCDYYRLKIASAARRQTSDSQRALRATDQRSPEYWRQVYRQCLKDLGY